MADESYRMDVPRRIGIAVSALMNERGLSRSELCQKAGISEADFEGYLSPGVDLLVVDAASAAVLERAAEVLGVDPGQFPEYRLWQAEQPGASARELTAAQEEAEKLPKGRWLRKA